MIVEYRKENTLCNREDYNPPPAVATLQRILHTHCWTGAGRGSHIRPAKSKKILVNSLDYNIYENIFYIPQGMQFKEISMGMLIKKIRKNLNKRKGNRWYICIDKYYFTWTTIGVRSVYSDY